MAGTKRDKVGRPASLQERISLTITLPPAVAKRLREAAERDRRPLANYVARLIEDALEIKP